MRRKLGMVGHLAWALQMACSCVIYRYILCWSAYLISEIYITI